MFFLKEIYDYIIASQIYQALIIIDLLVNIKKFDASFTFISLSASVDMKKFVIILKKNENVLLLK
jgi:hypothetical protein